MKTQARINSIVRGSLWSALLALVFGAFTAHAQFNLGAAAGYTVLYEGDGNNTLNLDGPDTLSGNIGIGNPSDGTVTTSGAGLSGNLTLAGNVDLDLAAQQYATSGNGAYQNSATFSGPGTLTVNDNVATVTSALSTVNSLYATLIGESGTALTINVGNTQTQTINASSGTLDSLGNEVFTVSSLHFVNGATLTINGTASQYVVINVTGNAQFGGAITLTGGITSDHVLFNINGTLQISSNGAVETGIFLDPDGAMSIENSVLDGQFFGGDSQNMQIVSGATVEYTPPVGAVPEPSTILSGVLLLLPLSVGVLRLLWQKKIQDLRKTQS